MTSLYAEAAVMRAAQEIVDYAAKVGVVLTIEQRPRQPLAMGNYETVVSTRRARHAPPEFTPAVNLPAQPARDTEDAERWRFVEKAATEMKTSRYDTLVWLLGLSEGSDAEEQLESAALRFDLGKRIDAARTGDKKGGAT